MLGITHRQTLNAPRTLVSTSAHHSTGSTSQSGPTARHVPAPLTTVEIRPRLCSTRVIAFATCSPSRTSAEQVIMRTFSASSRAWVSANASRARPRIATVNPALPKPNATARPIPVLPPVTRATSESPDTSYRPESGSKSELDSSANWDATRPSLTMLPASILRLSSCCRLSISMNCERSSLMSMS